MICYDKLTDLANREKSIGNACSLYLAPSVSYYDNNIGPLLKKMSNLINIRVYNTEELPDSIAIILKITDLDLYKSVVSEIKKSKCYVSHHPIKFLFSKNDLHVFIFKVEYPGATESFLKSKFSLMYRERDLPKIFNLNEKNKTVRRLREKAFLVCSKNESFRLSFERYINEELSEDNHADTWITLSEDDELDYLIDKKNELYYDESLGENPTLEYSGRNADAI